MISLKKTQGGLKQLNNTAKTEPKVQTTAKEEDGVQMASPEQEVQVAKKVSIDNIKNPSVFHEFMASDKFDKERFAKTSITDVKKLVTGFFKFLASEEPKQDRYMIGGLVFNYKDVNGKKCADPKNGSSYKYEINGRKQLHMKTKTLVQGTSTHGYYFNDNFYPLEEGEEISEAALQAAKEKYLKDNA